MSKSSNIEKFTIRVYGLFLNQKKEILLCDEYQLDMKMTKFPGGGMEFGEGTIDCLKREIREETGLEIKNIRHFYTTDFFQQGHLRETYQVVSIYYLADFVDESKLKISDVAFDFDEMKNGNMSFRRIPVELLREEDVTFPIDKRVAHMLREHYLHQE